MKENTGFFKGILALALVLGALLIACTVEPDDSPSFIGTWSRTSGSVTYTYLFNKDGSGSYAQGSSVSNFTWKVDGNTLTLAFGYSSSISYIWKVSDNMLQLTASNTGAQQLFTKK
jgi:outer membrane biogenesis lipoprotein LolB